MQKSNKLPAKFAAKIEGIEASLSKVFRFVNAHIFISVGIFATCSWIGLSYGLYISEAGTGGNVSSFKDAVWLGLVTMLTIGYGDHYPLSQSGRLFASGLMFTGIFSTGILTAKVSSIFLTQAILERRNKLNQSALKNHLIICGYKENMEDLIIHIMAGNEQFDAEQVVIVSNIHEEKIDQLRAIKQLEKIQFIKGEQQLKNVLLRAQPDHASRILILADSTPHENGGAPTPAEADAKTIMTAITLHSIARDTLVTAEIIDTSLAEHLKLAGVSDILYSREYSRMMLGNAMTGTGISNIMYDLLDSDSGAKIITDSIDEKFIGKRYADLKRYFETDRNLGIIVGVLTNAGNHHQIKERALREAQKTSNVKSMISGLNRAKNIRCNAPVFHPPEEYVIQKNSLAIIIKISETNPLQMMPAS